MLNLFLIIYFNLIKSYRSACCNIKLMYFVLTVFYITFAVPVTMYFKDPEDTSKNKKYPCYYCDAILPHMVRHLSGVHAEEVEVAEVLSKKTTDRDHQSLHKIVCFGIFNHSVSVLTERVGLFYIARSCGKVHVVKDYLPCKFCFMFFIKKELYRHCKSCRLKNDEHQQSYTSDGRLLLDGALMNNTSSIVGDLAKKVLVTMRHDKL